MYTYIYINIYIYIYVYMYTRIYIYSSNKNGENSTSAYFTDLPRQHVLTVRVDVPEPWNVQATDAAQV
jgi:hypothetical protein